MPEKKDKKSIKDSYEFFNRELSWLEFNARVLEEGLDETVPLLERFKYFSIVSSNFDEFFMIRVATIKRQFRKSDAVRCPSGLSPSQQLERITRRVHEITGLQYEALEKDLLPSLNERGLKYVPSGEYTKEQRRMVKRIFDEEIFLSLTPVRVVSEEEFPFVGNLRIHFIFRLEPIGEEVPEGERYAVVQVPPVLDRLQWIFLSDNERYFVLLEDCILENAEKLFQGYSIAEYGLFRISRDADLSVDEERDEDFVEAMEEVLVNRELSRPVRLEIARASSEMKERLMNWIGISEENVYEYSWFLDLASLMNLASTPGFDRLRYEEWPPVPSPALSEDLTIWEQLKEQDILLHHPYESFEPVIHLVQEACRDPEVLAVKMTLYRTSGRSPIVRALVDAAEQGKQVTVLVELKARFDEQQNIGWAERLQQAGAIVIYGLAHLKVHSKALLIVRREIDGIRRYAHLGTGNYNDKTAKLYTDLGLMTASEPITYETALFFNAVTGYSSVPNLNRLSMSPVHLKEKLLTLIRRERERTTVENPGRIMAKMNSLADPEVITELYKASQAGVIIQLNIRGICMLVPGIEGMSENIRVVSVIDRYLEHSRIFYFANQGQEEIYLSSADWMPRNLEKRVELMFPVESPELKKRLVRILKAFLRANVKGRELTPEGAYFPVDTKGKKPFRVQEYFYRRAKKAVREVSDAFQNEFTVRRTPRAT